MIFARIFPNNCPKNISPVSYAYGLKCIDAHAAWPRRLVYASAPLGGPNACMSYSLFFVVVVFRPPQNMKQPISGTAERIFMKLLPNDRGKCSFQRLTQMGARPPNNFLGAKN